MRKAISALMAVMMLAALCTAAADEPVLLNSFDCTDLEGNPADISLLDGAQVVLVDIWEAWCSWCLKEMPDFNELYELNRDNGFLVVGLSGISPQKGYDEKKTAEELGISYPLVKGTADMIPVKLRGFPTTLVYQRGEDGTLRLADVIEGYKPREEWNEYLKNILPDFRAEAAN